MANAINLCLSIPPSLLGGACGPAQKGPLDARAWTGALAKVLAGARPHLVLAGENPAAAEAAASSGLSLSSFFSRKSAPEGFLPPSLDFGELSRMEKALSGQGPQLFILGAGFSDPRPLLAAIRRLLFENPESLLLIDPAALGGDTKQALGFLSNAGFCRVRKLPGLSLVFASADRASYARFLSGAGLFPPDTRELIVTKEHPAFGYFGGIGSYTEEMQRLLGDRAPGLIYLGEGRIARRFLPSPAAARKLSWVVPETFFPLVSLMEGDLADIALDLVRAVLFFHPGIRMVEYQDCDAPGLRIAQARRAGLLPPGLSTRCRCHGPTLYLENGYGQPMGEPMRIRSMSAEKAAMELCDQVSFPTAWLKNFCLDAGFRLAPEKTRLLRYPFTYPDQASSSAFRDADTVIFFGRRTAMKGFPLFVAAVQKLVAGKKSRVKEILVLGARDPALGQENQALADLASKVRVRELSPSREEARELLSRLAPRAVCVICYRADNHPNCVLEAMAAGCPLAATNTGGIPELLPKDFHHLLAEPEPPALARAIGKLLALPAEKRQELARNVLEAAKKEQNAINAAHEEQARQSRDEFEPGPGSDEQPEPLFFRGPDAELLPGFHSLHRRYLAQNPDAACVTAFAEEGNGAESRLFRPIGDGIIASFFTNCLGHGTGAVNPSILEKLGIPCPDPDCGRLDPAFFTRVICAGGHIGVIPEILSRYLPGTGPFALPEENPLQNPLAAGIGKLPRFEAARLAALAASMNAFTKSPEWAMARNLALNPRLLAAAKSTLRVLSTARASVEKIRRR